MTNLELAWETARARFDAGWRPDHLLGDNTKLVKGEKFGRRCLGLSLAPADISGYEICASRSPTCSDHCIFTSGRGPIHSVMWGRIARTIWFFEDRPSFLAQLVKEIDRNQDAAIRLNVFSDWMWERQRIDGHRNIMERFPQVQFYDYTKHFKRMLRDQPDNYHLTFSLHETNSKQALTVLKKGKNVAAITTTREGTLFGYPVIDGEEHDLRFLDPSPCVVGLVPKGTMKTSNNQEMIYVPELNTSMSEAA